MAAPVARISVVMPCHNAASHLLRGVASVLEQTYGSVELIVINDGSTDNSLDILGGIRDNRLKIINQPNRGVSAARNRGIAEATGDYVAFLDTDDAWRTDCLEKLHEALRSVPDAAVAYCGWQNVGLAGGRGEPYIPSDYEGADKVTKLLRGCPWPIHAALTRTVLLREVGGFDETMSHAEDYKLWLSLAGRSRIVRVPEVLAFYHFHGGAQATKNRERSALAEWRVKGDFLGSNDEMRRSLDGRAVRQLTDGMLLKRGFECYWDRDLASARGIFRKVMRTGYGTVSDWKYMLPSVLPIALHRAFISLFEGDKRTAA
ncbi:MAG: glycosyltransferase [Desulfuromonadales bacterium]|nr:MAG: glycosyltransferase [Desulfuromonadales bacterium]